MTHTGIIEQHHYLVQVGPAKYTRAYMRAFSYLFLVRRQGSIHKYTFQHYKLTVNQQRHPTPIPQHMSSKPGSRTQSRAPSAAPEGDPAQQNQGITNRLDDNLEAVGAAARPGVPLWAQMNPTVDEVADTGRKVTGAAQGAVSSVGNAVGQVAGGGGGDKPLKLRLDLNLDVDIQLKARVHGDLTLALL
ncbi:hypothetical protein BD779DRAFT_362148 [Infundibulicybe gibba]|nr:hypothetical protein BD779DRAFT_362148 [Infundibulicybe gibba]